MINDDKLKLVDLTRNVKTGLSSYHISNGDNLIHLINVKDIKNGIITRQTVNKIKIKYSNNIEKNTLNPGDLIIASKGQYFRAAVANKSVEGYVISSNLLALEFKKGINPNIIAAYLNSQIGQKELNEISTGAIIKNLSYKNLLQIPVRLPSIEKQKLLVNLLEQIDEYNEVINREQVLINRIKDAIMHEQIGV